MSSKGFKVLAHPVLYHSNIKQIRVELEYARTNRILNTG